jgi:hypothetical protein
VVFFILLSTFALFLNLTSSKQFDIALVFFLLSLAFISYVTLLVVIGWVIVRRIDFVAAQNKLILSNQVSGGTDSPVIESWQSETFATFWSGEYSHTFKEIERKLNSNTRINISDFDFLIWLTWHTVENTDLVVTDAMQRGFENQFTLAGSSRGFLRSKSKTQISIGAQAQWYSARILSDGDLYNWIPSKDVLAIASNSKLKQLAISDNYLESIAAIRFGLPEYWLARWRQMQSAKLPIVSRQFDAEALN